MYIQTVCPAILSQFMILCDTVAAEHIATLCLCQTKRRK